MHQALENDGTNSSVENTTGPAVKTSCTSRVRFNCYWIILGHVNSQTRLFADTTIRR